MIPGISVSRRRRSIRAETTAPSGQDDVRVASRLRHARRGTARRPRAGAARARADRRRRRRGRGPARAPGPCPAPDVAPRARRSGARGRPARRHPRRRPRRRPRPLGPLGRDRTVVRAGAVPQRVLDERGDHLRERTRRREHLRRSRSTSTTSRRPVAANVGAHSSSCWCTTSSRCTRLGGAALEPGGTLASRSSTTRHQPLDLLERDPGLLAHVRRRRSPR